VAAIPKSNQGIADLLSASGVTETDQQTFAQVVGDRTVRPLNHVDLFLEKPELACMPGTGSATGARKGRSATGLRELVHSDPA